MTNATPGSLASSPEDFSERAYLYMLLSAFAFAVMGTLSHKAGENVDWRLLAFARTLIAFVISLSLCLVAGVRLVFFRPAVLWLRSLSGSLGVLCLFYALTRLPVSTTLTLTSTVPVWVALLAWPALGRRPTVAAALAIALSILGVILIQNPEASGDGTAATLALGNAACTAVAIIGLNKLRGADSRAVVAHFSGVSSVFTLTVLMTSGGAADYGPLKESGTAILLAGVGLSGAVGQLTLTRAFALGDPSRVSVLGLTQIVFAIPFDFFWWDRSFGAMTLIGIALVVAPSGWLMLRTPLAKARRFKRSAASPSPPKE